jgi:hypothetical protein
MVSWELEILMQVLQLLQLFRKPLSNICVDTQLAAMIHSCTS